MKKLQYYYVFPLIVFFMIFSVGGYDSVNAKKSSLNIEDVELMVQQAIDPIILQVNSAEERMGQLEESQFSLIDTQNYLMENQFQIQGTLNSLQSSVDDLYNSINYTSQQVGDLQFRVTQLEDSVSWLGTMVRPEPPMLLPGDLMWNVPNDINLVNGHELILNDFGLTLPGDPTKKVGADYWFYADLGMFEEGWNITLIPLAGQTSVTGNLKRDLSPGTSFQVKAYASYANRTWQKTITVHQP